ncbi:ATP-dependent helicase/deoxyribonuclease subunit B [Xylophilus ampelinus]|nr:ATP-dependent helicase/deoxyribonuclease subunit B [Xylophilus ampelinus]
MNAALNDPARALWCDPLQGLVARIAAHIAQHSLHPARTIVLVPYGQLIAIGRAMWAQCGNAGFAPRFETTRNWARSAGGFVPGEDDIAFDMARDLLTAQSLLTRAGQGGLRHALAGRLVDIAQQLAPLAAAQPPQQRAAWAQSVQPAIDAGRGSAWFDTESALNGIALAWVASSSYATDVLLDGAALAQADALIVLEGLQADPLTLSLAALFGPARVLRLPIAGLPTEVGTMAALHAADDPEDEAERATACVMQRVAAGQAPVALVATDRALTRRIGAQLTAHGVAVQDETGWKLSTTRAAAQAMGALRACAHDARSDDVLDWLKNAPRWRGDTLDALEVRLRDRGLRDWSAWCHFIAQVADAGDARESEVALAGLTAEVEACRATLARPRLQDEWLHAMRELLQAADQWDALVADAAGIEVIGALYLDEAPGELRSGGRSSLVEFSAWARDVLEAASVVLAVPGMGEPAVTVLPLAQLLGRAFAAVVIPGCDDQRLPASPEPPGDWTEAQRAALGLPSRDTLARAQRAAWSLALQAPALDLVWRQFDASGEPVRPSPFVQALRLAGATQAADDPRALVAVAPQPTHPPLPRGDALPVKQLSASAYDDLRHCPYRFFAMRQLGLARSDELEGEVDKRDFGNWLHEVLNHFHAALKVAPTPDRRARAAMISIASGQATQAMGLSEADFLPFAAAWPAVREGYLDWLAAHEADEGAIFEQAEPRLEQPLGELRLVGRLDRIDRLQADGRAYVIDYKTESLDSSKLRVKEPFEDTQLAFYAALLDEDTLRAAYVNVGEKASGTQTVEQTEVVAARDALVEGILHDLHRIGEGAAMPALGEGAVCEFCAARGLCRKDFWSEEAPQLCTPSSRVTPPPEGEAGRLRSGRAAAEDAPRRGESRS